MNIYKIALHRPASPCIALHRPVSPPSNRAKADASTLEALKMPVSSDDADNNNILVAIPLFDENTCQLPRQNERKRDAHDTVSSKPFDDFRQMVLKDHGSDPVHCAILLAIELIRNGKSSEDIKQQMNYSDGSDPLDYCHRALLQQALDLLNETTLVKRTMLRQEWNDIVRRLSRHVMYLGCEHPYVNFANDVVPKLTDAELRLLSEVVRPGIQQTSVRAQVLDLQKSLLDMAAKEPCFYAAILRDENILPACFSCFPSARLEWPGGRVVPLYANAPTATCTIMPVLDSESNRDDAYQQRTGSSCQCDRCQFELFGQADVASEPLARYYMARGSMETAKRVYTGALARTTESTTKLDILHALGAIELGLGNFMEAQRIWHEACGDDRAAQHAGLSLQREKHTAYGYFHVEKNESYDVRCPIEYPLPGAFVARVMDLEQCQKVIEWAETNGGWTTGRHYAVPTHDIPVHTVPVLLAWFRDELMCKIMNPLLVQYFGRERYYVHDAFFVKYEASTVSNYLSLRKSIFDLEGLTRH
jgi:tetratricopeptide (TPR) repeat protein